MSLVIADGLSLAYGRKVLLEDECFALSPRDRTRRPQREREVEPHEDPVGPEGARLG
jgi:hypothetical protein